MEILISCDWGTSALRLRVVNTDNMTVMAEATSAKGISNTFDLWKQNGKGEDKRLFFYQSILAEQIKKLEEQLGLSLQNATLIISGMASSNMGMMELPYKETPFSIDGHDLKIKIIEATKDFKQTILLISGVKTGDDAMRGEETQLIGCLSSDVSKDHFLIFPGTHSKHVRIKDGNVLFFKTYMTGEFFEMLSAKSILSNVIEKKMTLPVSDNLKSFENGVTGSLHSNLLHSSFLVRINYLFNKLSKEENYWYLSGLLIGTELKELKELNLMEIPVTIVSDELLIKLYSIALRKLGISKFEYHDAGKATIVGHCKIFNLYKSKLTEG